MAAFTVLVVLGLIIGMTAYVCRNCDGQIPDDQISL
jgi:hypothetical protein